MKKSLWLLFTNFFLFFLTSNSFFTNFLDYLQQPTIYSCNSEQPQQIRVHIIRKEKPPIFTNRYIDFLLDLIQQKQEQDQNDLNYSIGNPLVALNAIVSNRNNCLKSSDSQNFDQPSESTLFRTIENLSPSILDNNQISQMLPRAKVIKLIKIDDNGNQRNYPESITTSIINSVLNARNDQSEGSLVYRQIKPMLAMKPLFDVMTGTRIDAIYAFGFHRSEKRVETQIGETSTLPDNRGIVKGRRLA